MIVTTKELFQVAYGNFAVGAYNINNLEQATGLFRGNVDSKAASASPSASWTLERASNASRSSTLSPRRRAS